MPSWSLDLLRTSDITAPLLLSFKWDCLLQLSYVYLSMVYWGCGAEHCLGGHRALDEEEPQQSTALKEHLVSGLDLHEIMGSEPDAGIG